MTERDRHEAERLLVSSVLQHPTAIATVLPLWQQAGGMEWCQNDEDHWLLSSVMEYARETGVNEVPSRSWVLRRTRQTHEAFWANDPERDAKVNEAVERYEILFDRRRQQDAPPGEAKLWARQLATEVRNRKLHAVVTEALGTLAKGKIEEGLEFLIDQGLALKHFLDESPILTSQLFDPEEMAGDLELLRLKRDHPELFRGILSGIHRLDEETNGLQPSEMAAVVGAPGRGKSALLRDIMVSGAQQGARVLYVSAEMSKDLVRWQLNSRLTGWLYNDLKFGRLSDEEIAEFERRRQAVREQMAGEIVILDVPQNCSVGTVEGLIRERNLGAFDLFAWDHMGLMQSRRRISGQGEEVDWQMQLAVSNEIREFSKVTRNSKSQLGVVSWVALQERPHASDRPVEKLQATDINRSSAVAQGMHCIIHLIRDTVQAQAGEALLKLTKVRDGQDGLLVRVKTDLAHMLFLADQLDGSYGFEVPDDQPLGGF